MEISYTAERIKIKKELNELDKLLIQFTNILEKYNIQYVVISGYVAIVFGRNRASEDIDMFVEEMPYDIFKKWWSEVQRDFECLNATDPKEAYEGYLKQNIPLRFAKGSKYIPNIEMKFPQVSLDRMAMQERKELILNGHLLWIAPLEPQIIFKLFLGSEKDIEDARYLFNLFRDKLDKKALEELFRKLKIDEKYRKIIQ